MRHLILAVSLTLLSVPLLAHAEKENPWVVKEPVTPDTRLPPVLPGETVKRGGKKMKVWSTSGPVPVNPAPSAPPAPELNQGQPLSVIVDDRHPRTGRGQ